MVSGVQICLCSSWPARISCFTPSSRHEVPRGGGTEEREFRDAAPVIGIPREPGIRPIVAPPGDECYLLIRGVELLKLLHRHLYSYECSARRIKAWRLGGHVVIRQQRLP